VVKGANNPRDEASGRSLRADAKRNRDKLLAAADGMFSERGADASLDDIARRAKVGIGTLYRHFPTREALLAAACDERLLALAKKSRMRQASMAPGDALRAFLEDVVRHASMYRGLATSFGIVLQNGSPGCHATTEVGLELLEHAQRAGQIRRDVEFEDVVCIATAISLAASQSPARRTRRMVAMFIDGLRGAGVDDRARLSQEIEK